MKMKTMKVIFSALLLSLGMYSANAQIAENALGVRLSGGDDDFGIGPEVSWQHALGDNNRLEMNLGFRNSTYYDAAKFTMLYHWVWNIEGGFNWYAGLGAGVGYVDYDDRGPWYDDDYDGPENLLLTGAGNVGIEYNFPFPMQLALDLRPEAYFLPGYFDGFEPNVGFSIRYLFQ